MNRADLVFAICHLIGLRAQDPLAAPSWARTLANGQAKGHPHPATR